MYFEDLSPYAYHDGPPLKQTVLNVGWLDWQHTFSTGNTPDGFLEDLKRWSIQASARQMRGFQLCRLCRERDVINDTLPDRTTDNLQNLKNDISRYRISHTFNGQVEWLGTCEVWIPGEKGRIYASPDLIVHYVEEHLYLPPREFIEAVMKPIHSDWNADAVAEAIILEAYTNN